MKGRVPDVWAEAGKMRKLARLIVAFAPAATAVVLHRAGHVVVPIEPDVYVPVDPDDAYDRGRAHEAALFACYTMVRENRELARGEVLRVPVRVGAFLVEPTADVATRDYEVIEGGS